MIERQGNKFALFCDCCADTPDETFWDFGLAVSYKKRNGWKSKKTANGEWLDLCPECAELEAE